MQGLTQDYQLTLPAIMRRAEQLYGEREIVTRRPDKSFHRYNYTDFVTRAKRLAVALKGLGVEDGDRVGTLAWNTYQHLEAYFGVPSMGGVLHTLNPRLHEDDLAYIADHAGDKVMMVDEPLVPVLEKFRDRVNLEHVIVFNYGDEPVPDGMISYEDLISSADEADFEYPEDLDEKQAAAMCYTSGTTGRPKGALYSHRGIVLHSMMSAMGNVFAFSRRTLYCRSSRCSTSTPGASRSPRRSSGPSRSSPGPHLDPQSLLEDYEQEKVTFTAGVPTVFLAMLQAFGQGAGQARPVRAALHGHRRRGGAERA
jgi:fatty-acyl-CoA synthase